MGDRVEVEGVEMTVTFLFVGVVAEGAVVGSVVSVGLNANASGPP